MNCKFCQAAITAYSEQSISTKRNIHWFDCGDCHVDFMVDIEAQQILAQMYHRSIGEKDYVIHANHTLKKLWVGHPTLAFKDLIVDCDYPIDSITPTNVEEKLRMLLFFL